VLWVDVDIAGFVTLANCVPVMAHN